MVNFQRKQRYGWEDLLTIMQAVHDGTLSPDMVRFRKGAACCVVLASEGYPQKYETGYPITMPALSSGEEIFVAGAKREVR